MNGRTTDSLDGLGILEYLADVPPDVRFPPAIASGPPYRVYSFRCDAGSVASRMGPGCYLVQQGDRFFQFQTGYGWFEQTSLQIICDFFEQDRVLRNREYCRILSSMGVTPKSKSGHVFFVLRAMPDLEVERGDIIVCAPYCFSWSTHVDSMPRARHLTVAGYESLRRYAEEQEQMVLSCVSRDAWSWDPRREQLVAPFRYWIDISPWHTTRLWRRKQPRGYYRGNDTLSQILLNRKNWGRRRGKPFVSRIAVARPGSEPDAAEAVEVLLASIGQGTSDAR